MTKAIEFPYEQMDATARGASQMPYLSIRLSVGRKSVASRGLLDTGASLSVMPYTLGERLGLRWEEHTSSVPLAGNLARCASRAVVVSGKVGTFPPVRLGFAWAETDDVPLLLGQTNFFMEFDVCFFRSRSTFNIRPKQENA